MTGQARQHELVGALEAALSEQTGAERYRALAAAGEAREARRVDRPRPIEFDRNGLPVAQRSQSFVTRVARLLSL